LIWRRRLAYAPKKSWFVRGK